MTKVTFEAKVQELKRYKRRLNETDVAESFHKIVKRGLFALQGIVKKETPVDRGDLRNSWEVQVDNLEGVLRNNKNYGIFVHEGTKPHWVGVQNIRGWARRHGINEYALQKSIARKGTKANPFMDRAYEEEGVYRVDTIANEEIDKLLYKLGS